MTQQDELLLTDKEISNVLDKQAGTAHERFIFIAKAQLAKARPIIAKRAYQEGWEGGYQAGQQHSIGTDSTLVKEAKKQEREEIIREAQHDFPGVIDGKTLYRLVTFRVTEDEWRDVMDKEPKEEMPK